MEEEGGDKAVVKKIVANQIDPAGDLIIKVYSYNPPHYAIYRTRDRLIVQFADNCALAVRQRRAISPLAPMRGQINGLIDGWRHAGIRADGGSAEIEIGGRDSEGLWWLRPSKTEQFQRACRYDRRVSDALITILDEEGGPCGAPVVASVGTLETAQTLLAQVKNDIIAERTSIARALYIRWSLTLVLGVLIVTGLLASDALKSIHAFGVPIEPVWTAVSGGVIGALFSIAIGLKSREVVIDLQNRENQVDALLRMLIGTIAGGVLYCLLVTGLASTKLIEKPQINPLLEKGAFYNELIVFMIGFAAGFFERLVPKLLNDTNFGTKEPAGQDTPVAKAPAPDPRPKDRRDDAYWAGDDGGGRSPP